MKPGDMVRIDSPKTPFHGQIGVIVSIDKSFTLWPNNRIYYNILTPNGSVVPYGYDKLIHSSDGYFENNNYFKEGCSK